MYKILIFIFLSNLLQIIVTDNIYSQSITIDKKTYSTEQLIKEVLITGTVVISNIKWVCNILGELYKT